MPIKRVLGPLLAIVLIVGIVVAVLISHGRKSEVDATRGIVEVKGMIGSEKEGFFADLKVIELLKANGFRVKTEKVGSRQITSRDLQGYDFGFPAGAPAALELQKKAKAKHVYATFYTPMAIASWSALIPVMEKQALVKQSDGAYYIADMQQLLKLIEKGTRWNQLPGNTAYITGKSILINSTDVRTSNSAAMYLALASYIFNDNNVVDNVSQVSAILPRVTPLFLRQGLQESSSAGPFEDYTTMGMGKAPLVMIYESQFLEYQSKRAQPNTDMILLYPQPTIYTKHVFVPFSENGNRLGELLASDPELQKMAAQYGYRTSHPEYFATFLAEHQLQAPTSLVDVIDPPSYEMLERMIQSIEKNFQ
ncbi:hypothetical protein [Serratia sp. DD3]|uniref:hypothetical protein n=1 Tax=Serratia sp. DD3 TaxID=1410619 RepID=UPI0003FDB045|nr:hypothetical protein [Serratia sp. DD3]